MNVKLRKLTEEDAEYLKLYEYKNSDTAEIISLITLWNKNEYQGRYFECSAQNTKVNLRDFSA